jgi:uncharacterized delta-60 repeat protein
MNASYRSIILAVSVSLALSASISAAPGDLDPTFGNGGKRTDWTGYASGVAIQPDGKIVVVGDPNLCCRSDIDFRVARYNPDGSPDTTFGGGTGRVTTDFNGYHDNSENVVLQPDGKIIVAGWTVKEGSGVSLAVARYNPDGSLDTTFGDGSGKVLTPLDYFAAGGTDVAIQPDGRILVVLAQIDLNGNDYGLLVRYNADGSPDTSFDMGGPDWLPTGSVYSQLPIGSVTVQPADGKIVVIEGYPDYSPGIARYNTNGSLDTGFGSGGIVTIPEAFWLNTTAIDSAGKIVAAGGFVTGSTYEFALFRFNVDGSPDSSFDGDGIVTTPNLESATSIVIQSDGKIVAAGYGQGPGNYDLALARYNSNGSLDNTFGGGDGITTVDFNNSSDFGAAVALDNQGRAVVVGGSGPVGGSGSMFAIARFLGDPTPTCPNPIDCAEFFVRQHYQDFLNREPDASGLAFWTNEITFCGSDAQCVEVKRINVSAAYFLSIEFQQSGYLVYRFYKSAFGNLPGAPVPVRLSDFLPDAQAIGQGVIVNQGNWQQQLETNKQNYANAFVQRARFVSAYPTSMSSEQFVDALFANAGVTPSASDRNAAINEFAFGATTNDPAARARALRRVAENGTLAQQDFNRAFVLMQYFGYLRRNPNDAPEPALDFQGYNFWLNKLDQFNGDFVQAEMVKAFLRSTEYRQRFGP